MNVQAKLEEWTTNGLRQQLAAHYGLPPAPQNTIALSIHPLIKGKPAKDSSLLQTLGSGWAKVEAEWPDVFELITVDGYATSAVLKDGRKSEENFISRQLVMIDIDGGMTVPELFADEFYNEFGAGFYATPSYTDEHPKFRILFRAESAIANADDYRRLTRSLLRVYRSADPSCKDACRLFYGTVDCKLKEMRDSILPNDVIAILIGVDRDAEGADQTAIQPFETNTGRFASAKTMNSIVKNLHLMTDSNRNTYHCKIWSIIKNSTFSTQQKREVLDLYRKYDPDASRQHIIGRLLER